MHFTFFFGILNISQVLGWCPLGLTLHITVWVLSLDEEVLSFTSVSKANIISVL